MDSWAGASAEYWQRIIGMKATERAHALVRDMVSEGEALPLLFLRKGVVFSDAADIDATIRQVESKELESEWRTYAAHVGKSRTSTWADLFLSQDWKTFEYTSPLARAAELRSSLPTLCSLPSLRWIYTSDVEQALSVVSRMAEMMLKGHRDMFEAERRLHALRSLKSRFHATEVKMTSLVESVEKMRTTWDRDHTEFVSIFDDIRAWGSAVHKEGPLRDTFNDIGLFIATLLPSEWALLRNKIMRLHDYRAKPYSGIVVTVDKKEEKKQPPAAGADHKADPTMFTEPHGTGQVVSTQLDDLFVLWGGKHLALMKELPGARQAAGALFQQASACLQNEKRELSASFRCLLPLLDVGKLVSRAGKYTSQLAGYLATTSDTANTCVRSDHAICLFRNVIACDMA